MLNVSLSLSLSLSLSPSTFLTVLQVEEVSLNSTDGSISLIEGENARINIPREVIASIEGRESIRVVSFLYRNMSGLLPESLEDVGMQNDG